MQIRFRSQAIITFFSEDFPPPPAGAVLGFVLLLLWKSLNKG